MATNVPDALHSIYRLVAAHLASDQPSGIANAGSPGYHTSRADLVRQGRSGDYSIQCPADRRGDASDAAGLDLTLNAAEMKLVTTRLRTACTPVGGKYDPRIECLREFIGSLDGRNVCGYNRVATGAASRSRTGWFPSGFSDSSHRWHVHLSVLRDRVNVDNDMRGLAEVIAGVAAGTFGWRGPDSLPSTPETPIVDAPFLWDGKSYPGAQRLTVGAQGPWVTYIGERLVAHLGPQIYDVGPGPVWGQKDTDAVIAFKRAQGWSGGPTVGQATWDRLVAAPAVKPTTPKPPTSTTPKPTPPKGDPVSAVINVVGGNVLRRTDPEAGKARLEFDQRLPGILAAIRAGSPALVLLNELDVVTAKKIYEGLGFAWERKNGIGIGWDQKLLERTGDAVSHLFTDRDNRYLLSVPLRHEASGVEFWADVTHLENDGDTATDGHAARFLQSTEIAARTGRGRRVFFGDLNSTSGAAMPANATTRERQKPRRVLANVGWSFLSAIRASIPNGNLESHWGGRRGDKITNGSWIDDAGVRGGARIKSGRLIRTDAKRASDHHFLQMTVEL